MNNKIFGRNTSAAVCSEILAATLPFITIGLLGDKLILYISLTVGSIALLGLILCVLLKNRMPSYKAIILPQDFSYPYAIALSAIILKQHNIDASFELWLSLFLTIAVIITNIFIKPRTKK